MNLALWSLVVVQLVLASGLVPFGAIVVYRANGNDKRFFGFLGVVIILIGAAIGFGGEYKFTLTSFESRSSALVSLLKALQNDDFNTRNVVVASKATSSM